MVKSRMAIVSVYARTTVPADSVREAKEIIEHNECEWDVPAGGRPVFGWFSFLAAPALILLAAEIAGFINLIHVHHT